MPGALRRRGHGPAGRRREDQRAALPPQRLPAAGPRARPVPAPDGPAQQLLQRPAPHGAAAGMGVSLPPTPPSPNLADVHPLTQSPAAAAATRRAPRRDDAAGQVRARRQPARRRAVRDGRGEARRDPQPERGQRAQGGPRPVVAARAPDPARRRRAAGHVHQRAGDDRGGAARPQRRGAGRGAYHRRHLLAARQDHPRAEDRRRPAHSPAGPVRGPAQVGDAYGAAGVSAWAEWGRTWV